MPTSPTFVILVAEDDEDDRFLLTQAFAQHQPDCQIQYFTDGQRLLDDLKPEEAKKLPALILLDLNMPIFDGLSTLKQIKADPRLRATPVIMLTTSDAEQDIRRCYEAGANAYMGKPASYKELTELVDKTLRYWIKTTRLPTGS